MVWAILLFSDKLADVEVGVSTSVHEQIHSVVNLISFGTALLAACSGEKSNTGSGETDIGVQIPTTGVILTSTTEPTISTTDGLTPCGHTEAPDCYCWAEYTGQYIDYEFFLP